MFNSIKTFAQKGRAAFFNICVLLSATVSSFTHAANGIPSPVGTVDDGNYVNWLRDQVKAIVKFFAEFGSIAAFFLVAIAIILTFVEVQKGKKEWRDLFIVGGIGAGILIVVFFMFNQGVGVMGA